MSLYPFGLSIWRHAREENKKTQFSNARSPSTFCAKLLSLALFQLPSSFLDTYTSLLQKIDVKEVIISYADPLRGHAFSSQKDKQRKIGLTRALAYSWCGRVFKALNAGHGVD